MKRSLILSIILHLAFIGFLIITLANQTAKPPVVINLHKDADPRNRMIKAGIIDKNAVEQAALRQKILAEAVQLEKAKQEKAKKEQAQIEKQKKLAEEKLALEKKVAEEKRLAFAKKQAIEKKLAEEKRLALAKKEAVEKKLAQDKKIAQEKAKQLLAEKQSNERKLAAERRAAAIQAKKDQIRAEHDAFIESEVDKYKAEFAAAITENRILSSVFDTNLSCNIRIRLLPDGSILTVQIEKSSGNGAYDQMAESAVYKAAPFPMPDDEELYAQLRDIILSFKNGDQSADVS